VSRVWAITAAALVAGVVADVLVGATPPGFIAVYSFVGCLVIIVVSKWLGKLFLQRPEPADDEGVDA
jgi:hypothetical protein